MDITDIINSNGSITIRNISDYVLKFEDNKLTIDIKYSNINDSSNIEFSGSTIIECIVKKDDIIVSNNPKKYADYKEFFIPYLNKYEWLKEFL